jgi:diaminopimelate decarboxylase
VSNYVSDEEMLYAVQAGVTVSVDSLSQLERYGRLNPGGRVAVRINPGIGDGHHKKVITAGAESKFGVFYTEAGRIKTIAARHHLKIAGLNQHIGSNYLSGQIYLATVERLLSIAEQFADLDFIDFGGGMGIPYRNDAGRLDLAELGARVSELLESWTKRYGKRVVAQIEPGRYTVAESGLLLLTVYAIKENPGVVFVGTDGGFNVLARPVMYGSHHEIINTRQVIGDETMPVTVCGNICEAGDMLAQDRPLPAAAEGDVLAVLDAGAYGFSMSSNYNSRLRPAEVLITMDNETRLIRERDTLEDLLRHQIY